MNKPTNFYKAPPSQGPVGSAPIYYINGELPEDHGPYESSIELIPGFGLRTLSRTEVRTVSRNTKVHSLVAYACIMAWGGRNFSNYRASLDGECAAKIITLITKLRESTAKREEDFRLTHEAAEGIKGIGISFYTKLLFFLRARADAFILDQWTAKSATVLFPECGIKLTFAGLPHPETKPKTYEAFCKAIEGCVGAGGWGLAWTNGEQVERTIFDRPRGLWRTWLKNHLKEAEGARPRPPAPQGGPIEFHPPENPLEGEGRVRAFAEFLREVYLANIDEGVDLPEGCGGFNHPNRLHVIAEGCVTWQFIINQNEVRAQIFFYPKCVGFYDANIGQALSPAEVGRRHDFGGGIYGNGPAGGRTRAINRRAISIGGHASAVAAWPNVCQSAVDAMHQLFNTFDDLLP